MSSSFAVLFSNVKIQFHLFHFNNATSFVFTVKYFNFHFQIAPNNCLSLLLLVSKLDLCQVFSRFADKSFAAFGKTPWCILKIHLYWYCAHCLLGWHESWIRTEATYLFNNYLPPLENIHKEPSLRLVSFDTGQHLQFLQCIISSDRSSYSVVL